MFRNYRTLVPLSIAISMGWILSPEIRLRLAFGVGVSSVFAQTAAPSDSLAEADSLMEQAKDPINNDAIQLLQRAVTLYQKLKLPRKEIEAYRKLASTYAFLLDKKSEASQYKKALAIARNLKDLNLEGEILNDLGSTYRDSIVSGQRKKGVQYLQQALQLAQLTKNKELEAKVSQSLEFSFDFRAPQQYFEIASIVLNLARKFDQPQLEAKIFQELGEAYLYLKQYTQANAYYQKSLEIVQAIKKRESGRDEIYLFAIRGLEKNVLDSIGLMNEIYLKDEVKAAEAFQKSELISLEMFEKAKCQSDPMYALGKAHQRLNNYAKAIEYGTQALQIEQKANAECRLRQLAFLIEATAYQTRSPQNAVPFVQETLQIIQSVKNRSGELNSTVNEIFRFYKGWAEAKVDKGKALEGIQLYQQAMVIAQLVEKQEDISDLLLKIGKVHSTTKNFAAALNSYQQALESARAQKNQAVEVKIYAELDSLYSAQGESAKAEQMYQRILAIIKSLPRNDKTGKIAHELSDFYILRDEFYKGIPLAQQALTLLQKKHDTLSSFSIIQTLLTLGLAHNNLGDYQKSNQYLEEVIVQAKKFKLRAFESIGFSLQAAVSLRQNNPQRAIVLSQQAIETMKGSNSSILDNYMSVFGSGLEEVQKTTALVLQSEAYQAIGRYTEALEATQSALKVSQAKPLLGNQITKPIQKSLEQELHVQIGNIHYQTGSLDLSLKSYQTALAIDTQKQSDTTPLFFGLARIYRDQNQPSLAIAYYKQAVQEIEQVRSKNRKLSKDLQISFLESLIGFSNFKVSDVYRQLADLLLSQGRILEAQQVLELLKVQELKDFTRVTRAGGQPSSITLSPTEAKILEQHGSLITLGKELETCQKTNCATKTQLLEKRRALTEQFNQAIAAETASLQQRPADDKAFLDPRNQFGTTAQQIIKAQPGTVLVYPLVLENKLWLLIAAEGGILKKFEVPVPQKQLGETVLKFRQLLQSPTSDISQVQATGQQLYTWLIKPIESELKANQIKHLVFAPDRVTRYIPMGALHDGKQYLIENYTVSNILSANLTRVGEVAPLNLQETSVLALGLSQSVADLPPLPSVPSELDAIVRQSANDPRGVYPGKELLDRNFTFASLESNLFGHRILHIATHGKFEPGRPDASYLMMGDGQKLPIPKIETLQDLGDVKLVTLSACETALGGAGQDGTEIAGLSYYFLAKGAQAVMASLWLVNDSSTSQLMQKFYTNLSQPNGAKVTKAAALQKAQIALIRNQANFKDDQRGSIQVKSSTGSPSNPQSNNLQHPYYWAPFILIGNGL
jgi:CHAT domain-containing protein